MSSSARTRYYCDYIAPGMTYPCSSQADEDEGCMPAGWWGEAYWAYEHYCESCKDKARQPGD